MTARRRGRRAATVGEGGGRQGEKDLLHSPGSLAGLGSDQVGKEQGGEDGGLGRPEGLEQEAPVLSEAQDQKRRKQDDPARAEEEVEPALGDEACHPAERIKGVHGRSLHPGRLADPRLPAKCPAASTFSRRRRLPANLRPSPREYPDPLFAATGSLCN